jgi:hypothetical protein
VCVCVLCVCVCVCASMCVYLYARVVLLLVLASHKQRARAGGAAALFARPSNAGPRVRQGCCGSHRRCARDLATCFVRERTCIPLSSPAHVLINTHTHTHISAPLSRTRGRCAKQQLCGAPHDDRRGPHGGESVRAGDGATQRRTLCGARHHVGPAHTQGEPSGASRAAERATSLTGHVLRCVEAGKDCAFTMGRCVCRENAHALTHSHARTHSCTHALTHSRTHALTHSRTHARARTHFVTHALTGRQKIHDVGLPASTTAALVLVADGPSGTTLLAATPGERAGWAKAKAAARKSVCQIHTDAHAHNLCSLPLERFGCFTPPSLLLCRFLTP